MRRECRRSAEVAAAVVNGERFSAGDDDLHRHVACCNACADLALVMTSLRAERERSRRSSSVPSAGLVWWRAQLRQRQEAARRAAAPVAAVHVVALALALGLAAFLAWTLGGSAVIPILGSHLPSLLPASFAVPAASADDGPSLVRYTLILAATASLILGPVALYFALRKD